MKAPKCKFCGKEEWRHVCGGLATKLSTTKPEKRVANVKTEVANRHGKYADQEKRKRYMRELMNLRRALATGKAVAWNPAK